MWYCEISFFLLVKTVGRREMKRMRGRGERATVRSQKLMLNRHKVLFKSIYLLFFLWGKGALAAVSGSPDGKTHWARSRSNSTLSPWLA